MNMKIVIGLFLIVAISLGAGAFYFSQSAPPSQWTRVSFPNDGDTGIHTLEVFKDLLYASTENDKKGLRIWRLEDDESWKPVCEYGFGDAHNKDVMDMIPYKGMLYASTGNYEQQTVGQIWRSADGVTWEAVTTDAFDQRGVVIYFNTFAIYKDRLYVSASTAKNNSDSATQGVQIWRSDSGDPGTWERVEDQRMGDLWSEEISSFAVFNDALYAFIAEIWPVPIRLWRTEDGENWTVVSLDGLGDRYNIGAGGSVVYKEHLYVGILNFDTTEWSPVNPDQYPGPAQLWRSKDGVKWEAVMRGGFNNWHNVKVESLDLYRGQLYLGTLSVDWKEENIGEGAQIWRSSDGLNWTQANTNGFGDVNNWVVHQATAVTEYKGSLYFGTLNDQGGQIWKLSK